MLPLLQIQKESHWRRRASDMKDRKARPVGPRLAVEVQHYQLSVIMMTENNGRNPLMTLFLSSYEIIWRISTGVASVRILAVSHWMTRKRRELWIHWKRYSLKHRGRFKCAIFSLISIRLRATRRLGTILLRYRYTAVLCYFSCNGDGENLISVAFPAPFLAGVLHLNECQRNRQSALDFAISLARTFFYSV